MSLLRVKRQVKLQDIDAAGIVYFPRFLEYCHDAYFDYLNEVGINLPDSILNGPYILPLVHTEADFKAPLRFGDNVVVEVVSIEKGISSYQVNYQVFRDDKSSQLCCTAKTVHAAISRTTFKPLKELPADLCAALNL